MRTVTLYGGPGDGKVVEFDGAPSVLLIPVMHPSSASRRRLVNHCYSPHNGSYLGVEEPRNFQTPFPKIELFTFWVWLKVWFPHVNIDRSRTERKLTVKVSIPAAKGRR